MNLQYKIALLSISHATLMSCGNGKLAYISDLETVTISSCDS